ncbi:MAG: MurR/RpiR family transcriptional regulator [Mycoplasmatales bacterium]
MKKIFSQLENIARNDKSSQGKLAKYIIEYNGKFADLKITDLVDKAFVSPATGTRLAKLVGLQGFTELRYHLVQEQESKHIIKHNHENSIIEKYYNDLNNALLKTLPQLDLAQINRIVKLIQSAKKVNLFAVGGTQIIAAEFVNKLKRLKVNINLEADLHNQSFLAANSDEDTLSIGISYSAKDDVLKNLLRSHQNGSKTLLITAFSQIEKDYIDEKLIFQEFEYYNRVYTIVSKVQITAVLDIIYLEFLNSDLAKYEQILQHSTYVDVVDF